jgi:phenylpyruvate tautomerase PptA (4-oxalocrotonate tautomerase family)
MTPQMIKNEIKEIAAEVFMTVANFLGTNDESVIIAFIKMNDLK